MTFLQAIASAFGFISVNNLLWHLAFVALFVAWLVWFGSFERKRMNWALLHYSNSKTMARIVAQRLRALNSSLGKDDSDELEG